MIEIDVEFPHGVYTATYNGWVGPNPAWVKLLDIDCGRLTRSFGLLPHSMAADARFNWGGVIVAERQVPDPPWDGDDEDDDGGPPPPTDEKP